MEKSKPIIDRSLSELADERDSQGAARGAAIVAAAAVNVGLAISAILTTIYLMLLVDDAAGLPDPWGLLFGLLVGIVAIVPAELALVIWRARLAADGAITTGQRATAVTAMILAGIFSALTTSSFFSYFLPQLFAKSYLDVAPALNVGAIVGSWIVFIMAIVAYSVFSRQTQQNLSQARAFQSVFDARMVVLRSAAEAIHLEAERMVTDMNDRGVFRADAQQLILMSLGMDDNRLALPDPAKEAPARAAVAMAASTNPAAASLETNQKRGAMSGLTPEEALAAIEQNYAECDFTPTPAQSAANFTNGQNGQGGI